MSLINKMLQDLDARGARAPKPDQPTFVPGHAGQSRITPRVIISVVVLTLACGVAGIFAWRTLKRPAAPQLRVLGASATPVAPSVGYAQPVQALVTTVASDTASGAAASVSMASDAASRTAASVSTASAARVAPADAAPGRSAVAASALAVKRTGKQADEDAVAPLGPRVSGQAAPRAPKRAVAPTEGSLVIEPGPRESDPRAKADGEYRRALAAMQDGQINGAVAGLERVLRIDGAHDAARQTLVRLLLEQHRQDEAITQLQAALALDSQQPSLAMLLARLQIERGDSGVETLLAALPSAQANPDYQAFLGGALQRQRRHREATEHFALAVRARPGKGVWWMGLAVSLEADGQTSDAIAAFERAKAAPDLSAELRTQVERKLQQLVR